MHDDLIPTSDAVLSDPSLSFWIKNCLADALTRDPFDAAKDAELLSAVLTKRADLLIAEHLKPLGESSR